MQVYSKEYYQVNGKYDPKPTPKEIGKSWRELSEEEKEEYKTIAKTGKYRPPEEVAEAWGVKVEELNVNQVWRDE